MAFAAAGIVSASEDVVSNAFPDASRERTGVMRNDLSTEFFVAVSVYLATKVTNTVLDEAFADLYEKRVKPAFVRFLSSTSSRLRKDAGVRFDHWSADSGVLLRIDFEPDDEGQTVPDLHLVVEAVRLAQAHVIERGLTRRVMTYSVVDGALGPRARLSEPISHRAA